MNAKFSRAISRLCHKLRAAVSIMGEMTDVAVADDATSVYGCSGYGYIDLGIRIIGALRHVLVVDIGLDGLL